MPELANSSIPATPHDTGGASQAASDTAYIRALADMRELRIPFVTPQLYPLENGDLLIKDAPLLAEGEWTDSAIQTPLYYTAKSLETYAGNWQKKTGFNRHLKGVPRDESNRVSEAINPHYGQFKDDTGTVHNAILSDILVYGSTPSGRAMQELTLKKIIKYLSVEHGGDERYNPVTHRMESETLEFYGYAHVNKGACGVCRVNEAAPEPAQIAEVTPVIIPEDHSMPDTKELEAMFAAQGAQIKELSEAIKAQKPADVKIEIPKELSALPGTIKELSELVKAQAARIDALEKDGTAKTGAGNTKELSDIPEFYIPVDRKKGTIGVQ